MATDPGYDRVLREAADEFVMTVAVVAADRREDPAVTAEGALRDALSRLQERGVLGTAVDDDE